MGLKWAAGRKIAGFAKPGANEFVQFDAVWTSLQP
jgi:hypothetical protein